MKKLFIEICLIIFIVSFLVSTFSIFFDYFILTVFRIIFFIYLGFIGFFILHKGYKRYQKIAVPSPMMKFFSHRTNITFQIFLIGLLLVLLINRFYEIKIINLSYVLATVIVLNVFSVLFPYKSRALL